MKRKLLTNLSKKAQIAAVVGVFVFLFAGAGVFLASLPTRAASCDQVNIVRCGLGGGSAESNITAAKAVYDKGGDNGNNDIRQVFEWGGFTSSVMNDMNTSNTQTGVLKKDGTLWVGNRQVGRDASIAARYTNGSGFWEIKDGVWARRATTEMAGDNRPLLVHMNADGNARAAMMTDCGNPVRFVPVDKKPTPPPPPPVETEKVRVCKLDTEPVEWVEFEKGKVPSSGYSTNQRDCERKPVPKNPGISITKKVNGLQRDEVAVGEEFIYTLTVKNTGEVDLMNVQVTDTPATGVTLLTASHGTITTGGGWEYTIPSLSTGESLAIELTAKLPEYRAGSLTNKACVNAGEVNPGNPKRDDACDSATVTTPKPAAEQVYVCRVEDKTWVWVDKAEATAPTYSSDQADCRKEVLGTQTPAPTPKAPQPQALPDTGGTVAGVVGGTAVVAMAAGLVYKFILVRRVFG